MSIYNDRLGVKKNRKNFKINIPLDLACSNTPKILQKEKIDGICINNDYLCLCRGQNNLYATT